MKTIVLVAALVLTSSIASAQTNPAPLPPEPDGFTITPFIGVGFGGDLESAPVALGAAVGYGLSEKWVVEGDLYFMPDADQGQLVEFGISTWSLSASVLYHFTAENFTPYIAGGLGVINVNGDAENTTGLTEDDTVSKFTWNWGLGLKSAMTDRIGVRADLRYFTGDELAPDHWRLYGGVVIRRIGR